MTADTKVISITAADGRKPYWIVDRNPEKVEREKQLRKKRKQRERERERDNM